MVSQHGVITGELRRGTLVRTIGANEPLTDGIDELIKRTVDASQE